MWFTQNRSQNFTNKKFFRTSLSQKNAQNFKFSTQPPR